MQHFPCCRLLPAVLCTITSPKCAAFQTVLFFAAHLYSLLHNVGLAECPLVHYFLNEASYPGNKKMNEVSKYSLCLLQLLWQSIAETLSLFLNRWPHCCRMVHLNPGTLTPFLCRVTLTPSSLSFRNEFSNFSLTAPNGCKICGKI